MKKEYLMKPISKYLEECINKRNNVVQTETKEVNIINEKTENCSYVINTIISNGDSIGAIVILSIYDRIGEIEYKTAQIASQFFGKHIEE